MRRIIVANHQHHMSSDSQVGGKIWPLGNICRSNLRRLKAAMDGEANNKRTALAQIATHIILDLQHAIVLDCPVAQGGLVHRRIRTSHGSVAGREVTLAATKYS